jgi:hypothetical protein
MIYAGLFPYDLYTFAEVIVNMIIGFYDHFYLNLFHLNVNYRILTFHEYESRRHKEQEFRRSCCD